ncbi:MAG: hypothetical protein K6B13_06750 [Prevotella sp.]|nr:hypothetical protein [Prevotella sp.]
MMTIANPIYDSVFKFLMEDERVARTILSALLKKDIVNVEVRPHEYSNSQHIDDHRYGNDEDMRPILHRLLMAASDPDTRQDMNVEDEFYSIIEKRDTELLQKEKTIATQTVQLSEQKAQLSEQKAQLQEREAMLRSTIKLLVNAGMSAEQIAAHLSVPLDTVSLLL